MKRYPPHHHTYGAPLTQQCPICLHPGVTAYAIKGGREIPMQNIRRKLQWLYKK